MSKFDVKKSFKGAIRGRFVRDFVEGQTGIEIDDPDLAQVALSEGWIESHIEPIQDVQESDFPEDYAEFVVLVDIDLPEHLHAMVGKDKLAAGDEIGMSAAQAQELIEAGLIAPKADTAEPKEAKTEPAKVKPKAKAATEAPKSKAAMAAPKTKDAAIE